MLTVKFTDGEVVVKAEDEEEGRYAFPRLMKQKSVSSNLSALNWLNNLSPFYFLCTLDLEEIYKGEKPF